MRLLLYPHDGSENHGCEALVRSTVALTGAEAVLASGAPAADRRYGLEACCTVFQERAAIRKGSPEYLKAALRYHVLGDREAFDRLVFRPVSEAAKGCDAALSIGGDNYCYAAPEYLYLINRQLRKLGVKTVLWGCSIEPALLSGEMQEDLNGYNRIIARESLSFEALRNRVSAPVSLCPDPAFALKRRETRLPDGFVEGNTVGINVSPLALHHEKTKGAGLENVETLIRLILQKTDMSVALIPHVVRREDDDREPLGALYKRFMATGRVVMAEDRPAEELKDLIARCRFLVAARTHACVAAYSTQVPTLALGYSVKARGIARDIFGSERNYVLPVQSLQRPEDLSDAFFRLLSQETTVREHYAGFMPDYIGRTEKAKRLLEEL